MMVFTTWLNCYKEESSAFQRHDIAGTLAAKAESMVVPGLRISGLFAYVTVSYHDQSTEPNHHQRHFVIEFSRVVVRRFNTALPAEKGEVSREDREHSLNRS